MSHAYDVNLAAKRVKTAGKAGAHVEKRRNISLLCLLAIPRILARDTALWLPLSLAIVFAVADDQVAPSDLLKDEEPGEFRGSQGT